MTRHRPYLQKSMHPHPGISPAHAPATGYCHASPSGDGRVAGNRMPYRASAPYSSFYIHHSSLSFTFSAKERDSETGLSYFGSRYYSSDLSIWLSVDPMAAKYPSLSPYTYCADNPVRLVDPDGEDFDIEEKGNTLIIKATYFTTSKENREKLLQAAKIWNDQKDFTYTTKINGEKRTYNIVFQLSVSEEICASNLDASNKASEEGISVYNFMENSDQIFNDQGEDIDGQATNQLIQIRESASIRTIAHEIGHTLGIGDYHTESGGLMQTGGTGADVTTSHVCTILAVKSFGHPKVTWSSSPNVSSNFHYSPGHFKMRGRVKK